MALDCHGISSCLIISASRFADDGQCTLRMSSPCSYSRSVKKSSPPVCEKAALAVFTVGS